MSYLILCDSCTDLTPDLKKRKEVISIPLTIIINDKHLIDDENFNVFEFIKEMKASKDAPKSACPSPDDYMKYFDKADEIYIVTLSGKLSGSYNSAKLAMDLYKEDKGSKNIHIIDSEAASSSETLLTMKLLEFKDSGLNFEDTVKAIDKINKEKSIMFVLESLENLRKNGRLTGIKAFVAEALNIKPIMTAKEGMIEKVDQARGINRACAMMTDMIIKKIEESGVTNRQIVISHCNCLERAEKIRDSILSRFDAKVEIVMTGGISTLYASEGGIVISY